MYSTMMQASLSFLCLLALCFGRGFEEEVRRVHDTTAVPIMYEQSIASEQPTRTYATVNELIDSYHA